MIPMPGLPNPALCARVRKHQPAGVDAAPEELAEEVDVAAGAGAGAEAWVDPGLDAAAAPLARGVPISVDTVMPLPTRGVVLSDALLASEALLGVRGTVVGVEGGVASWPARPAPGAGAVAGTADGAAAVVGPPAAGGAADAEEEGVGPRSGSPNSLSQSTGSCLMRSS